MSVRIMRNYFNICLVAEVVLFYSVAECFKKYLCLRDINTSYPTFDHLLEPLIHRLIFRFTDITCSTDIWYGDIYMYNVIHHGQYCQDLFKIK